MSRHHLFLIWNYITAFLLWPFVEAAFIHLSSFARSLFAFNPNTGSGSEPFFWSILTSPALFLSFLFLLFTWIFLRILCRIGKNIFSPKKMGEVGTSNLVFFYWSFAAFILICISHLPYYILPQSYLTLPSALFLISTPFQSIPLFGAHNFLASLFFARFFWKKVKPFL